MSKGEGSEKEALRAEIEEGRSMYQEEKLASFAGEEDVYEDSGWEKRIPEVDAKESAERLKEGLEFAVEVISKAKGSFAGVHYSRDFYGYKSAQVVSVEDVGLEECVNKLASGKDWYPLYDDQLTYSGASHGDGAHFKHYVGAVEICASDFSHNFDAEPFYYVHGEPVTHEDFEKFQEQVRKIIAESYSARGAQETYMRTLPPELAEAVKKLRFEQRTIYVLENGEKVEEGVVNLKHGPYGSSYFGSGGGYGSVKGFDLTSWKNGERTEKELETESGDNGFVSGPVKVKVERGTIVICKGGDAIGREGRSWEEIYICE